MIAAVIFAFAFSIQGEIDAAAAKGGGRVTVPAGEHFSKGPIRLRSNVELHLAEGAKIVFSDDPEDYLPVVPTSWEGVECLNYSPLVYAYGCTNVAITGKGTLAPKMDFWRGWFKRGEGLYRADRVSTIKRSQDNPLMKELYEGVMKGKVHELLHVDYVKDKRD